MRRLLLAFAICLFELTLTLHAYSAEGPFPVQASIRYQQVCSACHDNAAVRNAPPQSKLQQFTPEAIYAALKDGAMKSQAQGLRDEEKVGIAEFLGGRKILSVAATSAKAMSNQCPTLSKMNYGAYPAWNGWGVDLYNSRYQPKEAAGISAEQVPHLKLKWAFGFPGASVVHGQPSVAGGRVFIGLETGQVYSMDARTGCVYWSYLAQAGVRSAISVGPIQGQKSARYAAYFGDFRSNVYAINAETGELLWRTKLENHLVARVTGAPKLYGGRLYVGVASMEEGAAANPRYQCCTFRGSLSALDANTGRILWKTYTIASAAHRTIKNALGVQQWGPSGVGIWNSPAIDPRLGAVYVGTGDSYTYPVASTSDSVVAFDMDTGKILWVKQNTPHDAWVAGCWAPHISENCPKPLGPDYDMSASPILRVLPNGRRLLLAGQKSGIIWAHDPDKKGLVKWKLNLSKTTATDKGEIVWGGAADGENVYFGVNQGGVGAVNIETGGLKWFTKMEPAPGLDGDRGQSGPVTLIPGVLFSGGWDGVLRALSVQDGQEMWRFNTNQEFETVNKIQAKGGSLGAPGPTVADGMLFVGSGYVGVQNGMPGNVLLAFAPE